MRHASSPRPHAAPILLLAVLVAAVFCAPAALDAQGEPNRPVLHGSHWVALTGKPLGAEAGAKIFRQGGNAVDAAAAMLAATSTMWDVLGWGGETQALIHHPETGEVIGINGLGNAPTGATPEFFRERDMEVPPAFGPLAAVTPGTPGALMTMLAEYGTMSLAEVLAPAIQMAEGYPIEEGAVNRIEAYADTIRQWEASTAVYLPNEGPDGRPAPPEVGQILRQPDLQRTLERLVETERAALEEGASRSEAIYAAYERFYEGDIAEEIVRSVREADGLFTMEDLADWEVKLEEPVHTDYRGYEVYKLTSWVQGPVMLQALNMLENFDLASMGYNSARYVHTLYQVFNRAFADRDFYYGDPYTAPEEPMEGLLSRDYAEARIQDLDPEANDPCIGPGDPYRFQEGTNPFTEYLEQWPLTEECRDEDDAATGSAGDGGGAGAVLGEGRSAGVDAGSRTSEERTPTAAERLERFTRGTTSIQAADEEGWVVSVTPSGGWIPAFIAGETGVGLSQRMQSFVLDSLENPYNVVAPGKRPRATLTPTLVHRDGRPWVSFAIQGGDMQDQNSVQFFLNMVEFDMQVNEAAEAANFNTYQLRNSFGDHAIYPGRLRLNDAMPPWVRSRLEGMGYDLDFDDRTSGPFTAVWFDREHGTFWGAASDYGDDYGIAW
ncbi:MAG: gamma-glutamyltransferase family protein [Gemmatimonadota bacterium]